MNPMPTQNRSYEDDPNATTQQQDARLQGPRTKDRDKTAAEKTRRQMMYGDMQGF
jgi:hypothetical protein